jgi:hypothetical protein
VAAGATIGGIAGGIAAERIAVLAGPGLMLPLLALSHLACARVSRRLVGSGASRPADVPDAGGALRLVSRDAYLRRLAMLVAAAAVATALVDFVFKARALEAFGRGPALMRFFAAFHATLGVATLLVQIGLGRGLLERFGLARTLAVLPGAVGAGAALALAAPGLGPAAVLRGLEGVSRHGLYRAGYEILYTPVVAGAKRSVKGFIDVVVERLSDVLGGALIQGVLVLLPWAATSALLAMAMAFSAAAAVLAVKLQRGYVDALRKSLERRALVLDPDDVSDVTTRSAVMMTLGVIDVRELRRRLAESRAAAEAPGEPDETAAALRSRDPARVRPILATLATSPADLTSHAGDLVALLDHDGLAVDLAAALVAAGDRAVVPLAEALGDPLRHVAARRRAARVLGSCPTEAAAHALIAALRDERFEVRVQAARALARLRARDPGTPPDASPVLAAVLAELRVDRGVWQKQQALEALDEGESPFVDDLLRERADRSLEHVFTLLALVLDADSLRIAYRGLHTDDEHLRGTALEYLEGVLPADVRAALWPRLEDDRRVRPEPRPRQEVLADLYRSHPSIELRIREAGGHAPRKEG